ncbi:hypothetical protein BH23CHL5_BH23CHL5_21610 [soil metagenome]
MSAQRRVATKQRRNVAPTAQAEAVSKPRPEPSQKPAVKPQIVSKSAGPQRESALRSRFDRLKKGAQNTWAEIKKVTWPDSETTRNLTMLVIAMSTVLGLLLGGIDFVLLKLFEAF